MVRSSKKWDLRIFHPVKLMSAKTEESPNSTDDPRDKPRTISGSKNTFPALTDRSGSIVFGSLLNLYARAQDKLAWFKTTVL